MNLIRTIIFKDGMNGITKFTCDSANSGEMMFSFSTFLLVKSCLKKSFAEIWRPSVTHFIIAVSVFTWLTNRSIYAGISNKLCGSGKFVDVSDFAQDSCAGNSTYTGNCCDRRIDITYSFLYNSTLLPIFYQTAITSSLYFLCILDF